MLLLQPYGILLNLLFVAFALKPLQRLSAVALLGLKLLLKDLYGLVKGFNGSALHLQLLVGRKGIYTKPKKMNE